MTGWCLSMARTSSLIREYILRSGRTAVKSEVRAPKAPKRAGAPMPNTRQPRKIRYTGAEWGRIMELARASGRPPARYVRETSLGTVPKAVRRENDDLIHELGRIGTILSQLAAAAKAAGIASQQTTIQAALTELLTAVRRLG